MTISATQVKELREVTGAGIMDCREALQTTGGDLQKAMDWLRQKGMARAEKKASRATSEGRVGSYIHGAGRLGVLVELNCETDFVAKNEAFQKLLTELCMQVAAMAPKYISKDEVPADFIEKEKAGYRQAAIEDGKPEQMADRIASGKVDKYIDSICLLEQAYIRDASMKVQDLIKQTISVVGENIQVKRFARFALGE
ncbi:MAG: translation elongation factor Ts [Burkholderiales bacterium]|nr:translation elongation factor Ts [Burkholderiales bacterium]